MHIDIQPIAGSAASKVFTQIANELPEYFGIANCSVDYAAATENCVNFMALERGEPIGLICLDQPYPHSCRIHWMGVKPGFQKRGIGTRLLESAEKHAEKELARFLNLETFSPVESDPDQFRIYNFYRQRGFQPLFDLKPYEHAYQMAYLVKPLATPIEKLLILEEDARSYGFDWANLEMIIDQAISECKEIRSAIVNGEPPLRLQEEIGDLIHTGISLCRFAEFNLDETIALITEKFGSRMRALKEIARERHYEVLSGQPTSLLMEIWQEAKLRSYTNHTQ